MNDKLAFRLVAITLPVFHANSLRKTISPIIVSALWIGVIGSCILWSKISYDLDFTYNEGFLNCVPGHKASESKQGDNRPTLIYIAVTVSCLAVFVISLMVIILTASYLENEITIKDRESRSSEKEKQEYNFLSQTQCSRSKNNLKKIKKSAAFLIMFINIFYTPLYVSGITKPGFISQRISFVLYVFGILFSPIVFGYMNKTTRISIKKCLRKFKQDPTYFGSRVPDSETRSIGAWAVPEGEFHRYQETRFEDRNPSEFSRVRLRDGRQVLILNKLDEVVKFPTETSLVTLATAVEGDEEILTAIIETPTEDAILEDSSVIDTKQRSETLTSAYQHRAVQTLSSNSLPQLKVPLALHEDYDRLSFMSANSQKG